MSNYLNSSYTSLNNLVSLYGDSGSIDTLVCKNITSSNDIILSKTNTYLSNDPSNNFVIKNQYPVYGPNSLIVDSKLLHFFTFDETVDLLGSYLKNQATGNYDLLIDSGVVIDGTLNIPSTTDTSGASILNSSYTLNSTGFTIGLWFQPVLPFNSFSRIFSLHSTTGINNDTIYMGVFVNNRLQLTINNGGTATSINYATNLTSNTLYFLCWVITPTSWTLFVNNTKTVYTTGITFPTNLVKNNTYLGKYSTNSNNITGFIDNYFLYNDVLNDSQINDIFSKYNTSGQFYNTIPIKYFEYGTLTGYDYTNLMSLDDSENMINSTTTSLQSQINNLILTSGTNVSSITIGSTSTLPAGSQATVVNVGTSTNLILNFGIPKGYNGSNGKDAQDYGDQNAIDGVGFFLDIFGVAYEVLAMSAIQTQLTGLQGQIASLQGQIAVIDGQIAELQAKTIFQSVFANTTRFTSNISINNGIVDNVILNQDGTIQTYGKITAVNSDIQCNRLIASDINTSSSSNTNINGSTINIGAIGLANVINIGNLTSFINLIGTVNTTFGFTTQNGFINQFG